MSLEVREIATRIFVAQVQKDQRQLDKMTQSGVKAMADNSVIAANFIISASDRFDKDKKTLNG